jgi:hypothetical protein
MASGAEPRDQTAKRDPTGEPHQPRSHAHSPKRNPPLRGGSESRRRSEGEADDRTPGGRRDGPLDSVPGGTKPGNEVLSRLRAGGAGERVGTLEIGVLMLTALWVTLALLAVVLAGSVLITIPRQRTARPTPTIGEYPTGSSPGDPGSEGMNVTAPGQIAPGPTDEAD